MLNHLRFSSISLNLISTLLRCMMISISDMFWYLRSNSRSPPPLLPLSSYFSFDIWISLMIVSLIDLTSSRDAPLTYRCWLKGVWWNWTLRALSPSCVAVWKPSDEAPLASRSRLYPPPFADLSLVLAAVFGLPSIAPPFDEVDLPVACLLETSNIFL